ncbi:MAG: adenosylcobinamide-GDP ribazoletransferase [Pseudonocardia sp.]
MNGLRLALSWLTVLPVAGPDTVGRRLAAAAIRWSPVVGLLLGGLAAGVLCVGVLAGLPPLLAGLLTVAALALATRGMHLDGLADTVDGLGCFGPPERALVVMRDGGAGPFAVVTLVLVLGAQVAAFGALAAAPRGWAAVVLATVVGRVSFLWCCRSGVPAARPDGLGALVADSQRWWAATLGWLAAVVLAAFAVPGRPWQGPLAVVLAASLVIGLSAHTRRRFGGVTGDVLGAATELATTTVIGVLAAGR